MQTAPQTNPSELLTLGTMLDREILETDRKINAIPESVSVETEDVAIQEAMAPADAIANLIVKLRVSSATEFAVKGQASAWLDGTYWPDNPEQRERMKAALRLEVANADINSISRAA